MQSNSERTVGSRKTPILSHFESFETRTTESGHGSSGPDHGILKKSLEFQPHAVYALPQCSSLSHHFFFRSIKSDMPADSDHMHACKLNGHSMHSCKHYLHKEQHNLNMCRHDLTAVPSLGTKVTCLLITDVFAPSTGNFVLGRPCTRS